MNDPVIQANASLVLNGDFTKGLQEWVKAPGSQRKIGHGGDSYQGEHILYMTAVAEGSASQQVEVPKKQQADVWYTLRLLYENTAALSGWLVVKVDGGAEEAIELKPTPQRNHPLVFNPVAHDARLTLPLERLDRISVIVVAPPMVPGNPVQGVNVTRIRIDLHLGPLVLQGLTLDGQPLSATRPLPLCLGAEVSTAHHFGCTPVAGNPWVDTDAALVSDDNPQGAIIAIPGLGVDHPLDGLWRLNCPRIEGNDPHLFSLSLINRYTADVYTFPASLGHHRLKFVERMEPAWFPVLEYGQGVRVGVRVTSYYTDQPLSGRTVNWSVKGQSQTTAVVTDAEGWAYFDFQSTSTGAGEFVVQASVESLYYGSGVVTEDMQVRVLATDPWKHVLAVVDDMAALWHEKTGYPNRGSTYRLTVRLPAGSPLLGTELALHWEGDSSAQLEVQVLPALEESVPVGTADQPWELICEDRLDGRFYLQLVCSKLLLPSSKKPMSLARNLVRIGEVQEANKFPVVDEGESVLLRVRVVHVVVSGDGDPVNNAQVDWDTPDSTISTRSGAGGWASVLYRPTRHGNLVVTAKVRAHADAVAVEHPFDVKALATSPWKNQIRILLDGVEVDLVELGLLCWRGTLHTLKVLPTAGSSLLNQSVTLNWRGDTPRIGLVVSDIGIPRTLGVQGLEWIFSSQMASSTSSLFTLQLTSVVLESPRDLFGRLISTDLEDELSVMLDQVSAMSDGATFYPCLGARHALRFLPNALSPLVGLEGFLEWQGTSADELDATVEPPMNIAQTISDGGAGWTLDFTLSAVVGAFSLALRLPGLSMATTVNPMRLDHNKLRIEAWREAAVDPVINQDNAWLWVWVVSAFTGQPVAQAEVLWTVQGQSTGVDSDAHGRSGFSFAPTIAGHHEIETRVLSRFDGYEEQRSLSVTALASDPWKGILVRFDGQAAQPWGGRTYFPRRNGEYVLEILAEEGSPLLDRSLTLGMTGTGPSELGVRFVDPGLGVPRWFSSVGLQYTFKCDDLKDGGFALRLAAERLANLSPANAMSLGAGSQVLKITGNANVHQVLDWEQELVEQVMVVSATTGKSIVGVTVTWHHADLGSVTSQTDFYGVARIRFKPRTPGASVLTATVGDELHSDSIALPFTLNEPRGIQALTSADPIGYPGKEVWAEAMVVSAMTGEPLPDVEVMWEYPGIKIAPTKTDVDGKARVVFRLPAIREGVLQATVRGGYGGWDVKLMEFTVEPNADTWLQEFTLWLDGNEVDLVDGRLNVLSGKTYELELRVNKHSWLIGWVSVALEDLSGAEALGLKFDPLLGIQQPVDGAPIRWSLSSIDTGQSGVFTLKLTSPDLPDRPLSGQMINFAGAVEVLFDTFQMKFGDGTAYLCHGATHTVTVRPTPNSSLLGMDVKLTWSGQSATDLRVVVTPPLEEAQQLNLEGVSWTLDCTGSNENGFFSLQLTISDWEEHSLPLPMSLGHNLVTAEHWVEEVVVFPGNPPQWVYGIRATSSFLKTPAPGVQVTIEGFNPDRPVYENTRSNGEVTHRSEGYVKMWIVNRYDGSVV
jgi:hypothetical protein